MDKKYYELSKEERAFIYQHVQELQEEVDGLGPVTVAVLKTDDDQYVLTYTTNENSNLETVGKGASVYEASFVAKEKLMGKLRLMNNHSQASPERSLKIYSILNGNILH